MGLSVYNPPNERRSPKMSNYKVYQDNEGDWVLEIDGCIQMVISDFNEFRLLASKLYSINDL